MVRYFPRQYFAEGPQPRCQFRGIGPLCQYALSISGDLLNRSVDGRLRCVALLSQNVRQLYVVLQSTLAALCQHLVIAEVNQSVSSIVLDGSVLLFVLLLRQFK